MNKTKAEISKTNLDELRKLKIIYGFDVVEFSTTHLRIVGARKIDYWPSTNRYWICGDPKGKQGTVAEIFQLAMMKKPTHTIGKRTGRGSDVYCGSVPPWDELLGEYREFTADEKVAGEVCVYRP